MAKSKRKVIRPPKKADPANKKLSDQEKVFVAAYCLSMNATQAAIDAGYSVSDDEDDDEDEVRLTMRKVGWRVKRQPHVAKAIRKNLADRLDAINVKAEDVLREITYIAFGRAADIVGIEEIDPDLVPPSESVYIMDRKGNMTPAMPDDVPQLFKAYRVNILDSAYWSEAQRAAVTSVKQDKDGNIQIQFADKQKALETLAKYFNLIKPDIGPIEGGAVMIVPATVESMEEWERRSIKSREQSTEKSKKLTG